MVHTYPALVMIERKAVCLCHCVHYMSSPNGSQPAQLLEGLAHNPLELQSGCSVLCNDTQSSDSWQYNMQPKT